MKEAASRMTRADELAEALRQPPPLRLVVPEWRSLDFLLEARREAGVPGLVIITLHDDPCPCLEAGAE